MMSWWLLAEKKASLKLRFLAASGPSNVPSLDMSQKALAERGASESRQRHKCCGGSGGMLCNLVQISLSAGVEKCRILFT
jgi:hypothetical protein